MLAKQNPELVRRAGRKCHPVSDLGPQVRQRAVSRERLVQTAILFWALSMVGYYASFAVFAGFSHFLGNALVVPSSICMALGFGRFKKARALRKKPPRVE